jgi:mono/diheme cytochrome c family protein
MSGWLVNGRRLVHFGGRWLTTVVLLFHGGVAQADDGIPVWRRGDAVVVDAGRTLFSEHCARCHSIDPAEPSAEGPDLRRLDSFCRRLLTPTLREDCFGDVDRYFLRSVLEGKVRAGVVHMPAWEGRLRTEEIAAIRAFTHSLRPNLPRRSTSVDQRQQAEPVR